MAVSKKYVRGKFKEIHLKYVETDFEKLKKIKDVKGLTWEDVIFLAMMNLTK